VREYIDIHTYIHVSMYIVYVVLSCIDS
jgi:hypothetical protein